MSARFDQLEARHSSLLARSAAQRRQLAQTAREIENELGRIDRGIQIIRRVARSPAAIIGAIALVAVIRPRRLFAWATRAVMIYTTTRRLAGKKPQRQLAPRIRRNSSEA